MAIWVKQWQLQSLSFGAFLLWFGGVPSVKLSGSAEERRELEALTWRRRSKAVELSERLRGLPRWLRLACHACCFIQLHSKLFTYAKRYHGTIPEARNWYSIPQAETYLNEFTKQCAVNIPFCKWPLPLFNNEILVKEREIILKNAYMPFPDDAL